MSNLTTQLRKASVFTSKSSGFDLSRYRLATGKTGQLIPIMCDEVLPRDKWSIGLMSQIDLAPMATAFQGRIDMRFEAFFVPNRLCWGGWQSFITMPTGNPYSFDIKRPSHVPFLAFGHDASEIPAALAVDALRPGSLLDALGCRVTLTSDSATGYSGVASLGSVTEYGSSYSSFDGKVVAKNALPLLAYHRIYDDWYRDSRIQTPLFVNNTVPSSSVNDSTVPLWQYPYVQSDGSSSWSWALIYGSLDNFSQTLFYNGDSILTIHQRNWADDLFTTCSLYPQASTEPASVNVNGVGASSDTKSFTIPQLRMANILQRWRERYNVAGQRYIDQMFAAWDIKPADAILQRPLWLGSFSHGVYTSPIFNQTPTAQNSGLGSRNPYNGQLGSSAGNTNGFGKDSLVSEFTATEHGYIIVLASLVPHAFYASGVDPMFNRKQLEDFADPLLQGLGELPVPQSEVSGMYGEDSSVGNVKKSFGYRPQYAAYKYHNDEVCGLLRNPIDEYTQSDGDFPLGLTSFALQRLPSRNSSTSGVEIDSQFLEIPPDFLDSVQTVPTSSSGYTWRGYFYFSVKCIRAFATYIIPTLENTQHMYTHSVEKGGKSING